MLSLLFIITAVFKFKFLWLDLTLFALLFSLPLLLKTRLKFDVAILSALTGWLILSVYATYQTGNLDAVLKASRAIISFINISIIACYLRKKISGQEIIILLGLVLLIHPLFVITEALFPYQTIILSELVDWTGHSNALRYRGLLNGTSSAGIFLGFCTVIWQYLYFVNGIKMFSIPIIFAYMLFPFTALTGFFIAMLGLVLLSLKKTAAKRIALSALIFMPVAVLLSVSLMSFSNQENKYVELVEDRILNLVGVDGYSTKSGNPRDSFRKLKNSYSLPESQFILGNGHPSKAQNATTNSDAGIIVNLHKFGILGILVIGLILFLVGRKNEVAGLLSICFVMAFFKNDFFLSRIVFDLFMFVAIVGNRKYFFRESDIRV